MINISLTLFQVSQSVNNTDYCICALCYVPKFAVMAILARSLTSEYDDRALSLLEQYEETSLYLLNNLRDFGRSPVPGEPNSGKFMVCISQHFL